MKSKKHYSALIILLSCIFVPLICDAKEKRSPGETVQHFYQATEKKNINEAKDCIVKFEHSSAFSEENITNTVKAFIKAWETSERTKQPPIKIITEKIYSRFAIVIFQRNDGHYLCYLLILQKNEWKMTFDDDIWVVKQRREYNLTEEEKGELEKMFSWQSQKIRELHKK